MTKNLNVALNDYSRLNKAVDTEADKYRSQIRFFHSQTFLYICAGIAIFALGLALAFYIYKAALVEPQVRYIERTTSVVTAAEIEESPPQTMQSTPEQNRQIRTDLQKLESRDEVEIEEIIQDVMLPPEKQYTAFTTVVTETGESIVTGRTFVAGQWDKPTYQYCYLALPGIVGGAPMVEMDDLGELQVVTDDPDLIRFSKEYCRFEIHN